MATTKKAAKKTAKKTPARSRDEASGGFSAEERAAMKERAAEMRAAKRGSKADPEQEVLAKIAEMAPGDRAIAEGIHALVKEAAPDLTPRTWYGMPAYAKDGKVLCFFQDAGKFKARYATLGFQDVAALDDGAIWPTAYAVTELTPAVKKQLTQLLRRATG